MLEEFLNGRVVIKTGDITEEDVDAIVNAANSTLLGGGGVDGAIHAKGGRQILEECRMIRQTSYPNGSPTGEAVITSGGDLKAKYVIHTVGPIYGMNDGKDGDLLAACYENSLRLAVDNQISTVAFPSISTGAYGYPRDEAARVSSGAVRSFLSKNRTIAEVRLVFFSASDLGLFLDNHFF